MRPDRDITGLSLFTLALFSGVLVSGVLETNAIARLPSDAPPLPAPEGQIVRVADTETLYIAVERLQSGTTIVLEQGIYSLHRPIVLPDRSLKNVGIRGATGDWDDVILHGNGMNDDSVQHGIMVQNVDGFLIADMTIRDVFNHPVTIDPSAGKLHLFHCHLVDAGEQFVKANSNNQGGGSDGGIVEYCLIEYSGEGPKNGYTNGVDVHGGKGWSIRHNLFKNIRSPAGAENTAVPSVLMWNGAADTICEGNTFVDCDRAVAFGLVQRERYNDHTGGIIRNNFVVSRPEAVPNQDCGIFVHSPGAVVVHNTVLLNGGYPNAIEVRWPGAPTIVHNNLTDSVIRERDGARIDRSGNALTGKMTFRNRDAGDLHRTAEIRAVPFHRECPHDWDGRERSPWTAPGAAR